MGKNRYETFAPGAHADPLDKLDLETAMRRGLAVGEFSVHYQPVVILPSGDVVGAEALARWNSAEHGSISPATFIPLAEDIGLISELGERVLVRRLHAAPRMATRRRSCRPDFSISVNLSTKQLEERRSRRPSRRHASRSLACPHEPGPRDHRIGSDARQRQERPHCSATFASWA